MCTPTTEARWRKPWRGIWTAPKRASTTRCACVHKDGSMRHVLSRGVAIRDESGAPYRMVGLDTDVTRLRRVQTVLDAVADGTAGAFGEHFFAAMVQHFARALEVDCAFIAECVDDPATRVRTLAYWSAAKRRGRELRVRAGRHTLRRGVERRPRLLSSARRRRNCSRARRDSRPNSACPSLAATVACSGSRPCSTSSRSATRCWSTASTASSSRAAAEMECMQALARLALDPLTAPAP